MSWSNSRIYDSIEILENGSSVQTLPGSSTGTTLNLAAFGTSTLSVIATANGSSSAATTCVADCPVIAPPASPTIDSCVVDHTTCMATISWTNNDTYTSIAVSVDGTTASTLAGTATTATVALGGPGTFMLCLNGTDGANCTSFAEVCCSVTCFPPFQRGDANNDGFIDVSDPVRVLGFEFLGESADCLLALDADDDNLIMVTDALYLLATIFQGGTNPPAPFGTCSADPTPGPLSCDTFTSCP